MDHSSPLEADKTPEKAQGRQQRRSPAWRRRFLDALKTMPNICAACDAAGVARSSVYRERQEDEEFAAAWDEAIEYGCDRLEEALFKRAVEGVKKTVFYRDQPIGEETSFSDTAAIFLLKGQRPEKYADRKDITTGGKPITVQFYLPEREEPTEGGEP